MQAAHLGWSLVRRSPRDGGCHSPTRLKLLISRLITRPFKRTAAKSQSPLSCVLLEKNLVYLEIDELPYLLADGANKNFFTS